METAAEGAGIPMQVVEDTAVWKNPDEINCTEKEYMQNFKFDSESAGKWVKLNMKADGIFIVWSNQDINLYDGEKNKIKLLPVVKNGDVLYIQLPEKITEDYKIKGAYIRSCNGDTIQFDYDDKLMNGTGSNQYLNFTVEKKTNVQCRIVDYKNNGLGNISIIVQKKSGNKWKNVSTKRTLKTGINWDAYTHSGGTGSFGRNFCMTLKKGDYRLKVKSKKDSIYEVAISSIDEIYLAPDKYGYTKKKAVELFDYDPQIEDWVLNNAEKMDSYRFGNFTYTGKNTHWYKLTKDKKKKGTISIKLGAASAGTMKISIYKKGTKKALKTKVVKPTTILNDKEMWSDSKTVDFNVKKKGIYYIKIQRDKKTTTGAYNCSFSYN